jgi:anti-anti-sigma factor
MVRTMVDAPGTWTGRGGVVLDERATGDVVVTAPVEVDIATAPELSAHLARARAAGPERVVVDFGCTTFCGTDALDVLLAASADLRAHGCALEIRSPGEQLVRLAQVFGLSDDLGLPVHLTV